MQICQVLQVPLWIIMWPCTKHTKLTSEGKACVRRQTQGVHLPGAETPFLAFRPLTLMRMILLPVDMLAGLNSAWAMCSAGPKLRQGQPRAPRARVHATRARQPGLARGTANTITIGDELIVYWRYNQVSRACEGVARLENNAGCVQHKNRQA